MELNLRSALEKNGATLDENQIKFVAGLETALRSSLENNETKVSELIKKELESAGTNDEVSEQLRGLAEQMEKIEKSSITSLNSTQKRTLRKEIEENRDDIVEAIRSGKSLGTEDKGIFQLRAAAVHLDTNTVSLGAGVTAPLVENVEDAPALAFTRYPENFLLNTVRNMQVAKVKQTIFKTEQAPTEGDAAVVAEAGTKPLIQYKFVKNALSRKKYAGRIEWSEEFEMDNDMLFNAIVNMIERDVIKAWNNGMIADVIANAVAFTTSPQDDTVILPDASDVAIVLQGLIDAQNYAADTVVLNPATIVSLMLIKKTDGERISNPMFVDGRLNGMNVIASNQMTAGQILVLDSSIYSEMHSDINMRVGTYGTQFITNENTLICEMFSILDVAQIDLVGSRYGAIATIEAALLKP